MLGIYSMFIFTFAWPAFRVIQENGGMSVNYHHADLGLFFLPFVNHPLFRGLNSHIFKNLVEGNPADSSVFLGYTALIFLIYCFLRCKDKIARFWKIVFLVFFILSLGPHPVILGRHFSTLPLPFFFLAHTPFYAFFGRLSFIAVLVSLSQAVLVAYSFDKVKFPKPVLALIIAVLIFELYPAPYIITRKEIPDFYKTLENDRGDYAILEVPTDNCPSLISHYRDYYYCFYQYWQTLHHKPIVGGYMARKIPQRSSEFVEKSPFIRSLNGFSNENRIDSNEALYFLKMHSIKYVILHKYFLYYSNMWGNGLREERLPGERQNFEEAEKICSSFLKKVSDNRDFVVYALP